MVTFELENVTTGWCKNDSEVMQEFSLSPLLFNIHVRELAKVHGVMGNDDVMEWNIQTGFLYAVVVCLMASIEDDMKVIMEQLNARVIAYGLKVNEKKSMVCV